MRERKQRGESGAVEKGESRKEVIREEEIEG